MQIEKENMILQSVEGMNFIGGSDCMFFSYEEYCMVFHS